MDIRKMTDEELAQNLLMALYPGLINYAFQDKKEYEYFLKITKFIRLCVKDSQPKGLSKEEIRNILYADDTIDPFPPYRCLPPIDKTTANVKAERIFEAQQALASVEGKDNHVA